MTSNDRSIVGLVAIAHAMVHTYELSIPIFVTVWTDALSIPTKELGLMVGVGYALFGLGAIPGGILSDRIGSRGLIAVCLAGMGGSFALLSISSSPWALTASMAAWGIAASVYHPAGLSLISKGVTQRGRALALHGMAGNAGIAFGPLATALLLAWIGDWQWVAFILAVPAALATAYALTSSFDEHAAETPEETAEDSSEHVVKRLGKTSRQLFATAFAGVFAIVMLSGLYYRGVLTFLPDMLGEVITFQLPLGLESEHYVYAGILMIGMLGQFVGGKLTDRYPTEISMLAALTTLSLIALAFLPVVQLGTVAVLAGSAVLGFFLFLVQPLYQATVAEYTPARARGLSYGFTYLGVFGIGAIGAPLAGWLLDVSSAMTLFVVLSGVALAAASISGWLLLRSRRADVAASP
ncbi:MFS transporter [Longibacter salinarum]|uniref:MFS transporter n=1 Tax=Longibacter salinarum TaxID=1850348 RepID=A0A2A8CVK4_9BACT|nr:MFS transporter [Longibacter salinarum]PEN12640.1 MFS transporter [Longibacter salinarum]